MGDPLGIGPEVLVKALADPALRSRGRWVIYGTAAAIGHAERLTGVRVLGDPDVVVLEPPGAHAVPSLDSHPAGDRAESGAASFACVESGIAACLRAGRGEAPELPAALVTAPISKAAWHLAGHTRFPGHTELLAERCNAGRTRMMFVAPNLRVILATTHVALSKVPGLLTTSRVLETIELGAETCRCLGVERPRVAVCGVNPHASEGGLFGDEEVRAVAPAVLAAREKGIDASGPFPGDTIFNAALKGRFDLVVAMYHDQGLIPVKLLAFDRAVNATVGLPIVRTSPDHGTAYDIAGKGVADAGSMKAAIHLALDLVGAG